MFLFVLFLVAVAWLAVAARRPTPAAMLPTGRARWAFHGALASLGLAALLYLVMGLGEILAGDLSGAGHLGPAAAVAGLGLLARRRPDVAGDVLLGLGAGAAVYFLVAVGGRWEAAVPAIAFSSLPFLLAGLLLKLATGRRRRAATSGG